MKSSSAKRNLMTLQLGTRHFSLGVLERMLPDVPTALFFAKAYKLSAQDVGQLLYTLFNTPLISALLKGEHSTQLQDYLDGVIDEANLHLQPGEELQYAEGAEPKGELLPLLWEQAEVQIATSIQEVADKLEGVLDKLPGKTGEMVFTHLREMNRVRGTIGDYRGRILHKPVTENLVILDVSGSMSEQTIREIIDDVVALSYKANAHLAIVSNQTFHWVPGAYSTAAVLAHAEYGGTRYETLAPLFDQDWGTVITIADYDSYHDARKVIAKRPGRIGQVLDISLVDRPTFMAECVGQLAMEVKPLLMSDSYYPLSS